MHTSVSSSSLSFFLPSLFLFLSSSLSLVAIMFESGKFFYMDPVTGIETINADPSSQVFYNTVLVFAGVTLFGSLLYYFIVFCAEVLGRLPSWFIKCCADKKRNKLDSFRMDNSIKFEDNPWAGGHIKEIKSAQKEEAKNKEELTALKAHREQLLATQTAMAEQNKKIKQGLMGQNNKKKKPKSTRGKRKKKGEGSGAFGPQIVGGDDDMIV